MEWSSVLNLFGLFGIGVIILISIAGFLYLCVEEIDRIRQVRQRRLRVLAKRGLSKRPSRGPKEKAQVFILSDEREKRRVSL